MRRASCIWIAILHFGGATYVSLSNPHTDSDDEAASRLADRRAAELCRRAPTQEFDRADARAALEYEVGEDNIILQALREANSSSDVGENLADRMELQYMGEKLGSIGMAFAMVLVWFVCCWTACPFKLCRCCCQRCCVRERRTFMGPKIGLVVCVLGIASGLWACTLQSAAGYGQAHDGFDHTWCVAAELLNVTIMGQEPEAEGGVFVGVLPLLDLFWGMESSLEEGSDFFVDLNHLLDVTEVLDPAVVAAMEVVALLGNVGREENRRPITDDGTSLMHECQLCAALAEAVAPLASGMQTSLASALSVARLQVQEQLSPENARSIAGALGSSAAPLVEFKSMLILSLSGLIDDGGPADSASNLLNGGGPENALISVVLVAFIFAFFALCSSGCFVIRERRPATKVDMTLPADISAPLPNPYNRCVPRTACCVWCCGFFYAMFLFFFAGIIQVMVVPLSSLCLIADDLDKDLLISIAPAIGYSAPVGTSDFDMVMDLYDQCVARADPTANVMDLLYVSEAGRETTLRDMFATELADTIDLAFSGVTTALSDGLPSLGDSPEVEVLLGLLRSAGADATMLPVSTLGLQGPYLALASDPNGLGDDPSLGLQVAFATSMSCADTAGSPVHGLDTFVSRLSRCGTTVADPAWLCGTRVMDNLQASPADMPPSAASCESGFAYADLKRMLLAHESFRCDIFESPNDPSQYCDPKDMVDLGDGFGSWSGDCISRDAAGALKMIPKARTCTLAEFVQYVSEFDERLTRVFARLDSATAFVTSKINVDMRGLTDTYIVSPVNEMMDTAGCGALGVIFQGFVDGMCYQGVYGMSQIGYGWARTAGLTCILMLLQFGIWRRSVDNYNAWALQSRNVDVTLSSVVPVAKEEYNDEVIDLSPNDVINLSLDEVIKISPADVESPLNDLSPPELK